jgi:hypothetical protein
MLCATAHATKRGPGGLNARGFTFRPAGVRLFDDPLEPDGAAAPAANPLPGPPVGTPGWFQSFTGNQRYPKGSWWDGYPRGWIVSRSVAITGAAFASAMGRQSLGTTQALLVAFNVRLGGWVPNPRFAGAFSDRNRSPRVSLGYLLKELLSRHDPTVDPFVYVADGGHRENLGLVELLREHPKGVLVVDASGDTPGRFTTLRQAIQLAETELGVTIDIDLDELRRTSIGLPRPDAGLDSDEPNLLPATCATTGTIRYPDATRGVLVYGRYQICATSDPELIRFAAENPPFPNYSTGDQFLTEAEFTNLVKLGEQVGRALAARVAAIEAMATGA